MVNLSDTYMKVNLCKTGGPWSYCGAKNIEVQENCTYYEKASCANRCMYYIFECHCDNYWAQRGKIPPEGDVKENKDGVYKPCEGCKYDKTCTKRATSTECDDEKKKKEGVKAFQDK